MDGGVKQKYTKTDPIMEVILKTAHEEKSTFEEIMNYIWNRFHYSTMLGNNRGALNQFKLDKDRKIWNCVEALAV